MKIAALCVKVISFVPMGTFIFTWRKEHLSWEYKLQQRKKKETNKFGIAPEDTMEVNVYNVHKDFQLSFQ